MPYQMDSKNCCHGRYTSIGFERNVFNRTMNTFDNRWFIASLKKFIALFGERLVTFIMMQHSKFPSITKQNMVLQDAFSSVDAAKQFYKVI